jgi:hypothetical protein
MHGQFHSKVTRNCAPHFAACRSQALLASLKQRINLPTFCGQGANMQFWLIYFAALAAILAFVGTSGMSFWHWVIVAIVVTAVVFFVRRSQNNTPRT